MSKSVHFLENHDEPRAASLLRLKSHKAAAAFILFLPGMALLHDGQLEGRKHFARIQLARRASETVDPELSRFYQELLGTLPGTAIRTGKPALLPQENPHLYAVQWEGQNGETDLGVVNFGCEEAALREPEGAGGGRLVYSTSAGLCRETETVIPPESAHILRYTSRHSAA